MRAKLFIVTYDNPANLHLTLESLFASDFGAHELEVVILNNHTRFGLAPEFAGRVAVIHNAGRPDFSTGHLARSWNQCLMHGFVDLRQPQVDVVVTAQTDTLFHPRWLPELAAMHGTYTFVTFGAGDNFCSYRPEAVRAIGMWDERFCGIGYQEADYFLRAFHDNRAASSVNDGWHGREVNPWPGPQLASRLHPRGHFDGHHLRSMAHHVLNKNLFYRKWPGHHPHQWDRFPPVETPGVRSAIENYVLYPYFELAIDDLAGKNYFCDTSGSAFFDPDTIPPPGG